MDFSWTFAAFAIGCFCVAGCCRCSFWRGIGMLAFAAATNKRLLTQHPLRPSFRCCEEPQVAMLRLLVPPLLPPSAFCVYPWFLGFRFLWLPSFYAWLALGGFTNPRDIRSRSPRCPIRCRPSVRLAYPACPANLQRKTGHIPGCRRNSHQPSEEVRGKA